MARLGSEGEKKGGKNRRRREESEDEEEGKGVGSAHLDLISG